IPEADQFAEGSREAGREAGGPDPRHQGGEPGEPAEQDRRVDRQADPRHGRARAGPAGGGRLPRPAPAGGAGDLGRAHRHGPGHPARAGGLEQQRRRRLRQPAIDRGPAKEGDPPDPQASQRQRDHRRQQVAPAARGDPVAGGAGGGDTGKAGEAVGISMLNLAGSSFDFGQVLFAVLTDCEHRRRSLAPEEAAEKLLEAAREKLAEIHESYVECGGTEDYFRDLEREVLETALPQYVPRAVEQTRREREGYDLWRGGDPVARAAFTLLGLVLGGLI